MKDLLRKAEPSKFEDLVAFCAIYRPGALSAGMVDTYIKRKLGKEKITYSLPETKPILEETYGVIVYQEQVMQIAVEVAGFSMGEADVLRKAMGKKKPEVMAEQKEKFLHGAEGRGVARSKAKALWEHIEPFAGYGFNKSHSVAYTLISFQTGFLKAHHPVAYMAAMLSSEMGTKDNVAKYIQECRQMDIRVLPPDVNESAWSFTVKDRDIRFSLGAVKGLGEGAVEAILEARQQVGRFESLSHFAREVDLKCLNHRVFESLIKAGCFDELGTERGVLSAELDSVLQSAQRRQRDREVGQNSLFAGSAVPAPKPRIVSNPWSEKERLQHEKDALGFYLTGHPLSEHQSRLEELTSDTTGSLRAAGEGRALLGGVVTRFKTTKIKSGRNAGRMMGRFELEDLEGVLPVAVFADSLQKYRDVLVEGRAVLVKGVARERGGDVEITLEEISSLERIEEQAINGLLLDLRPDMSTVELMELRDLLTENSGSVRVSLNVDLEGNRVRISPQDRFKVNVDNGLLASLEKFLGGGRVHKQFADQSGS
jgi:DNA polymerase-3 subunit alpha